MRYLLIGNGPSVLDRELGSVIDDFDGLVVRFNDYRTEGWERYVGSRTDVWWTTVLYQQPKKLEADYYEVGFVANEEGQREDQYASLKTYFPDIKRVINREVIERLGGQFENLGFNMAFSTGAICAASLAAEGHEIWLHGFDSFDPDALHHYYFTPGSVNDKEKEICSHNPHFEKMFFVRLRERSKVFDLDENAPQETIETSDEAEIEPVPFFLGTGRNFLLIGNGPSAVHKKAGELIDDFDGTVVRFNDYHIDGYEDFVGTRTDIWVVAKEISKSNKAKIVVYITTDSKYLSDTSFTKIKKMYPKKLVIPISRDQMRSMSLDDTNFSGGKGANSSGASFVNFLTGMGHKVFLHGFDHFDQPVHHYGDSVKLVAYHSSASEKPLFDELERQGKVVRFAKHLPTVRDHPLTHVVIPKSIEDQAVKIFGNHHIIDTHEEAIETYKNLRDQGKEVWVFGMSSVPYFLDLSMKNDCFFYGYFTTHFQSVPSKREIPNSYKFQHWHSHIADKCENKSVLLIGKSLSHAKQTFEQYGVSEVKTCDPYKGDSLLSYPENSADVVVSIGFPSYLCNDLLIRDHAKRIAKHAIYIGVYNSCSIDIPIAHKTRLLAANKFWKDWGLDELWHGKAYEAGDIEPRLENRTQGVYSYDIDDYVSLPLSNLREFNDKPYDPEFWLGVRYV